MPILDTGYDSVLVGIIEYVYHYEVVRADSFERARLLLLDSFGCAMESLNDPSIQDLIGPYLPDTITPHGFCLPGTAFQEDPIKGAFDFGTMIRFLDHNDALGGKEWGHPSDNLGAILAVMDWLDRSPVPRNGGPPLTIKTLLEAMIKAYEIEGCFQIDNSFNEFSIDHTILVKVASAAVISWLAGLSKEMALAVLSQAWMDGHPLRTFRAHPNTNPRKGWAAGDACSRAVHLLYITMRGLPAGPKPLTAQRWGFYDSLYGGKQFNLPVPYGERIIHDTVIKLVACEGHILTAAEAALQLCYELRRRSLQPQSTIQTIKIRTQRPAMLITNKSGPLLNPADRDHCYQYVVAVVLLKGALIEAQDYRDDSHWASSSDVDKLRNKMELQEDEGFTRDYYDPQIKTAASGISIRLLDGTWLAEAVVHTPMGHPRHPETIAKTVEKYKASMSYQFTPEETANLSGITQQNDAQISDFVNAWRRPNVPNDPITKTIAKSFL